MAAFDTKRCLLVLPTAIFLIQLCSVTWLNAGDKCPTTTAKSEAASCKMACCDDKSISPASKCCDNASDRCGNESCSSNGSLSVAVSVKLSGNPLISALDSLMFRQTEESDLALESITGLIQGCCPNSDCLSFHLVGGSCGVCDRETISNPEKSESAAEPKDHLVATHETFESYRSSVEAAWAKSNVEDSSLNLSHSDFDATAIDFEICEPASTKDTSVSFCGHYACEADGCDYSKDEQCPTGGRCPSDKIQTEQLTANDCVCGDHCPSVGSCSGSQQVASGSEPSESAQIIEQLCRDILAESNAQHDSPPQWLQQMQLTSTLPPAPAAGPLPAAGVENAHVGQNSCDTPLDSKGSKVVFYEVATNNDQSATLETNPVDEIAVESAVQSVRLEMFEEFSETREEYLAAMFENQVELEVANTQLQASESISEVLVENATLTMKLDMVEEMSEMRMDLIQQVFEARLEAELANAKVDALEKQNAELRAQSNADATSSSASVKSALDAKELSILRRQCQLLNQELAKSKMYVQQLRQQLASRKENVTKQRMPVPFAASAINTVTEQPADVEYLEEFDESVRRIIEKSLSSEYAEMCETPDSPNMKK